MALVLECFRCEIVPDHITPYFDVMVDKRRSIPSLVVWNADETRLGSPEKRQPPNVIVAPSTKPGSFIHEKDDAQFPVLIALSAVGDSTFPMFLSKYKSFDKNSLAIHNIVDRHDCTMRNTRVYRQKTCHTTHGTPRVMAFAGSQKLSLIRLVVHSSHIAQPLDLCLFGLFERLYSKERISTGMKGETKKMSHALLALDKVMIIPIVRWSLERAGCLPDLSNMRNLVQIDANRVLTRIAVPSFERDDSFIDPDQMRNEVEAMTTAHKWAPTPKPRDFAISFAACIQAARKRENEANNSEGDGYSFFSQG
jgi:hypothetical protein